MHWIMGGHVGNHKSLSWMYEGFDVVYRINGIMDKRFQIENVCYNFI